MISILIVIKSFVSDFQYLQLFYSSTLKSFERNQTQLKLIFGLFLEFALSFMHTVI